jgi:hypothetical protein
MADNIDNPWTLPATSKWSTELDHARSNRWSEEINKEKAEKMLAALKASKDLLEKSSKVIETLVRNKIIS